MRKLAKFAVQGVFEVKTIFGGDRKGQTTVFEARVTHITARSERAARRLAQSRFRRDVWVTKWPAPYVAVMTQRYLGLAEVLHIGPEFDDGDVWYELRDTCPAISERPPRKRGGTARQAERRPRRLAGSLRRA